MTSERNSNNPVVSVTVTVYYVGQQGNSPSGEYLFFLSQDVVHVTQPQTEIHYNLSADTVARGIRFTGYFATDSHKQVAALPGSIPKPGEELLTESIKLIHANDSESLLVRVSLQVTELQARHRRGGLDPQITNVPSPH
ncbi:hypothetical protein RugamoR64_38610 [Duganella rhizosphaerae]|uniref:hypothetical protein n=1 Tax=Duganella rhizosphaerae TaxID=2885763 RepID=UPI0030E8892C